MVSDVFPYLHSQVDAKDWKFNSNTISLDEEVFMQNKLLDVGTVSKVLDRKWEREGGGGGKQLHDLIEGSILKAIENV